ncbi:hypothetical protein N7481_000300 [Penicillium waksmanii]|uniref:uncharacterized protein n=1 Tax=Penicillium waksmanii TaxID=69791 RepID=UPI0025480CC1|nr:uncharacterized protein N7481_000300 [Penicillium waksmanii]KAJ5999891.1 hypothetical protein N7481_000300 [Penicillium waksmanii]
MAHPPLETFQIGWLCALPIEAAAAIQMLDEKFGLLGTQEASDPNTYTLGRIWQHNVAIACLPAGQYGNTSATTVANNMVRTFSKSLRIGLMVGIGGGIPSAAHDIRLGDVVISCPEDTSGGVLQYDMGKVDVGGKFVRTGSLNSPPRSILTAANLMRATELTDDPRFPEYIASATERTPRTRKSFGRPKAQQDRLFKLEHVHPLTVNSCDGCPAEWEQTRSERESSDPQMHYGIIASGNAVIKHGWTREQLRLETGALCFEMEAAGLMLDFPCIVIRGICDYADSHKNKQWQGYAALAAASYAKELLSYLPEGSVSRENLMVDVCKGLKEEIKGTNQRIDRAYEQQEQHHHEQRTRALTDQQQRCHQAFKIGNYTNQKNINPERAEGTCQWALQSPEYVRWRESCGNELLWVSADPGCGKSVLARSIIDNFSEASSFSVTIIYFFFKDNDEQNTLCSALCTILHQLFSQRPHLLQHALPSWERNRGKIRQEVDELWRIFITATSADSTSKTICIFDALDECREIDQGRLMEKLKHFRRQWSPSTHTNWLKFLVTSRPYNHIKHCFEAIADSFPHIHLKGEEENDQIHEEIDLVVKIRVEELARTARLSSNIRQRLEQQLLQMEHRTYLWLHLAMDDIKNTFENSLRPAEESIRLIPASVNAAYNKILSRIPFEQVDTVRKILQIVVAARRPLTIREMAMALGIAICPQSRTAADAEIDPVHLDQKLRRLCGLFVFTNNSKIYLVHQTAREFLIRNELSHPPISAYSCNLEDTEEQMAQICLRYLSMDVLENNEEKTNVDTQSFLNYSAIYWADHVRSMSQTADREVDDLVLQLYNPTGQRFSLWFPIFWEAVIPCEEAPAMNAIHLAAFNGHEQVLRCLFARENVNLNQADSTGIYPVIWASKNGHEKAVQVLLGHGADVNAQSDLFGTALQAACFSGHSKVVRVLLEHGGDINPQGGLFGNPLHAACSRGDDRIVQVLIEHGADVNTQGDDGGYALQRACSGGHENIVQGLLEHGADVNAQGGHYGNALQAACFGAHVKVIQMLLRHGADVNSQAGDCENAFQTACSIGFARVVRVLLEHRAGLSIQCDDYGNALQVACSGGHDKVVQVLLEHGANVNAEYEDYGNALQAACQEGHEKIVRILLEHGANANTQYGDYGSVLHIACLMGFDKVVQVLLEHGADVNSECADYGSVLHIACSMGFDKVVQVLLEHGADVNSEYGDYGSVLSTACQKGHEKIVRVLLEHGADANTQYGDYGSVLHIACSIGFDKVVQVLLEHGADVNSEYADYGSVLHIACSMGFDKVVQVLLEHGADVNSEYGNYGSVLSTACQKGHERIVRVLLEHGADANTQYGDYGSVLHIACSMGFDKVVQVLLEHGANVNSEYEDYGSVLSTACSMGFDKVVQVLLGHRADVNTECDDS